MFERMLIYHLVKDSLLLVKCMCPWRHHKGIDTGYNYQSIKGVLLMV
jgi:hypothetical protein